MVDFNSDMTITTPAYDIIKILILQRRDSFLEALEAYNRTKHKGVAVSTYEVQSRLTSLYEELRSSIHKGEKKEVVAEIEKNLNSKEIEEILKAWHIIDEWIYSKKLTMFDTGTSLKGKNIVEINKIKGWRG